MRHDSGAAALANHRTTGIRGRFLKINKTGNRSNSNFPLGPGRRVYAQRRAVFGDRLSAGHLHRLRLQTGGRTGPELRGAITGVDYDGAIRHRSASGRQSRQRPDAAADAVPAGRTLPVGGPRRGATGGGVGRVEGWQVRTADPALDLVAKTLNAGTGLDPSTGGWNRADRGFPSVPAWSLYVLDDQKLDGSFGWLQSETELLLER